MGAQFRFEKIEKTDEADVTAAFSRMQDDDRYENGHSYSGGFGMATGLTFNRNISFNDEQDAYDWLDAHAVKWEDALAVKHTDETGAHIGWFIGANCAS